MPWEWLISTTPRPWLYLVRYSFQALATSPNAVVARLWVISAGSPIPAIVNCRYIGANGRQTDAKRETWIAAIARISGSIARVASGVGCPLTVGYT